MEAASSIRVPELRRTVENRAPLRADGAFVLYWMTAFRRVKDNFALDRAVELARALSRPLVVLEALRADYAWASDRLHRFVLDGMADNAAQLARTPVRYYPYVEPALGAGRGLLEGLAQDACAVVTDDSPVFFLPRMRAAAARRLTVRLESVDSGGLLPMRATDRVFYRAYDFRRFLQQTLPAHLEQAPATDPFAGPPLPSAELPRDILERWPPATPELLSGITLADLPIDHRVAPVDERGGATRAGALLRRFIDDRLEHYDELRNHPDDDAASGLSPYLHFGHISTHRVFAELARHDGWDASMLADRRRGQRAGWWGMHQSTGAFLDQLVTWRELGFNMAWQSDDYESYGSLPAWARRTLDKHAGDARPYLYPPARLEAATTHDPLWNAAQRQLVAEGRISGYLRMLWGKKVLEWSSDPECALATLFELNNRYALDGRDPNSASGICWCLGRYDRAWGPERPVFGTVRYMSSDNTRRKLRVKRYLARWAE